VRCWGSWPGPARPWPCRPPAAGTRPGGEGGWLGSAGDLGDRGWADFLAGADLRCRRLPKSWDEGPFLGNGFLGTGVYAEPGANAIRFTVQHTQVQDHRSEFGSLFGPARLPIGSFTLEPAGAITGVDWRLDLWNAEPTATIVTTAGSLALRAVVPSERSVLAVEVRPTEGERKFRWVFHPSEAVSPRTAPQFHKPPPAGYAANPPASLETSGPDQLAGQSLLAGGEHVTAWREVTAGTRACLTKVRDAVDDAFASLSAGKASFAASKAASVTTWSSHCQTRPRRTLYTAVAWSHPRRIAAPEALRTVRAAARPLDWLVADHRTWWHRYYRQSFGVHSGHPAAVVLLDPAVQSRVRHPAGRPGDGDHRALARADPVARGLVEPQRAAGSSTAPTTSSWTRSRRHWAGTGSGCAISSPRTTGRTRTASRAPLT
jgi:alpha-L-fucosidase 2